MVRVNGSRRRGLKSSICLQAISSTSTAIVDYRWWMVGGVDDLQDVATFTPPRHGQMGKQRETDRADSRNQPTSNSA